MKRIREKIAGGYLLKHEDKNFDGIFVITQYIVVPAKRGDQEGHTHKVLLIDTGRKIGFEICECQFEKFKRFLE